MIVFDQTIKSSFDMAAETVEEIVSILRETLELDKAVLFRINFMLREVINNAVEHGNRFDEEKLIHIRVDVTENRISFFIRDQGEGFKLSAVEHIPDHHLRVRSRGIFLIKEFGFHVEVEGQMVHVMMPIESNN